jgi:hypothetical protein
MIFDYLKCILVSSDGMGTIVDGFVNIDVTITNFKIETAIRIGTNPGFVLYCSALTTEVRKGNQISKLAFLALGVIIVQFQKIHLPSHLINAVYNKQSLSARGFHLDQT